jgi:hypothetical protein
MNTTRTIWFLLLLLPASVCAQNTNPAIAKMKNFVRKYHERKEDVTIVLLDGSVSTDMGYASKRPDASYRPPCFTEYNIPSFIEEKLRWPGEQYRRYDAMRSQADSIAVFSEIGNAVTAQYDSAWDWQNKPPVSNGYNGLTRIISGYSPGVAYLFPHTAKRCDFIYRTDYLSSAALMVRVNGKKGLVELYDETSGTWKEANGYIFSAKEKDTLLPATFFPGKPFGATALRKSVYQKRLKMRCLSSHPDLTIRITSTDGGRLCYWGVAYSPATTMLQFINSARGGHDIAHLEVFEPWSVDYWQPDLILYPCNTINEGADASAANTSNSPVAFTNRFENFINKLLQKSYHPELFAYILFTAKAHGLVDSLDHIGVTDIQRYGKATVFDFIHSLDKKLKLMPIASANVFPQFWKTAQKQARKNHTSIYLQLFGSCGPKGPGFTTDDTHLNDRGELLGWKYLSRFFYF